MKKKHFLTLDNEFVLYCQLNKIDDVEKLAQETFNRGFSFLKYPDNPLSQKQNVIEKIVIKEVPVEVIKEVIVEKIVEVIKEVPVKIKGETKIVTKEVIVEVPVIKEITNEKELQVLKTENEDLKNQLEKINQSLSKFNRGSYMKNSDLGSLYSE